MKPMLAKAPDEKYPIRYPRLASTKLDGFRGLVKDGMLLTRKLLPIPNRYTQDLFGSPALEGLDGELTVGPPNAPDLMQRCQSELTSEDGEPDVTFWVFDYWTRPGYLYQERYNLLQNVNWADYHPRVRLLPHTLVHTPEDFEELQATALAQGYEGMISRDPNGPYKYGRSTAKEGWMLKHKPWVDREAVVIGFEERYHNANEATVDELGHAKRSSHQANLVPMGELGALVCMILNGEQTTASFKVSPGVMTQDMRKRVWETRDTFLGAIVTFTTFEQTGVKNKPRHNIFKAFRHRSDL